MKNFFKHIILFVAVAVVGLNSAYAQLYPVQLTPVFNTPYSVKLSDYATSMDTKMRLMIIPSDISILQRQVRLKLSIKGNGLNIQSSDYIQGQQPLFINGGEFHTLTNTDLAALFRLENLQGISALQYANGLPEGMYDFCFEMYDFVTNQRISQKSCAMMYLQLNDPPLLNTPQKNEQIAATNFPNILFTWTPRNINATNVSYKFELKQLMDPTMDQQFAFQMSSVLYEETLFGTALMYNLNMPILTPGMRYAWRVRSVSTTGLSENAIFKNDGYSEIYSFKYTASCAAPTFLLSEAQGPTSVKVSWQGIPDHTRYQIQYKKQDVRNAQWFSTNSLNTQSLITNLEPGVTYQFRVGSSCDPATDGVQSFTYSNISTFIMPTQSNGVPVYNCGIVPKINIQNQNPLINLIESETFTAGDFAVRITELSGSNGIYSGKGVIDVPYLENLKLSVKFDNISINTNYQLFSGVVETAYDPSWKNVVGIDPLIEDIFGPQSDSNLVTDATTDSTHTTNDSDNIGESSITDTETDVNKNEDVNSAVNVEPIDKENPEKESNSTIESSNTDNNSGSENKDDSTQSSKKGYFIEYKNKKYYTGEKIQIPFNRNSLAYNSFTMGELEKDTNVKYELSYESDRGVLAENVGGNSYLKKSESKTGAEFDFSFDNTFKYSLKSTADVDKKANLSNEIDLVVKPFQLTSLKAIDNSNTNRYAVNGETLYYVTSKDYKDTQFQIAYTPNLSIDEIPKDKIKWKFNDTFVESKNGENNFSQKINKNKDIYAKVTGGYLNGISKDVSVKWIKNYNNQVDIVSPAVKNALNELGNYVNNIGAVLRKLDNTGKLVFNISFQGQEYLEEDINSRFYNIKREGGFGGSIDLEFKGFTYGVDLKVAVAQLYLKPILSVIANGKMQYVKRNDKDTFTEIGTVMTFGLQADLRVGGEVGFDVKAITAKIEPYAGVSSWGEIKYLDNVKRIEGSTGIGKPYVGIKGDVLLGGYNVLPSLDYKYTWDELKVELPFKFDMK